jgi:U3 small nucleolar RNA-associated protein 23
MNPSESLDRSLAHLRIRSTVITADAIRATKLLAIHHCGHETAATPSSDCLFQQISQDNNVNHFFVATQDRALQRKVSNSPGGAVLFATVNGIQMEMPSERQKKHMMKTAEERQLHMGEMERRLLEDGGHGGHGGHGPREGTVRRKKTKGGPNPLSVKRRKPAGAAEDRSGGQKGDEASAKRKRQRKSRESSGAGTERALNT